jgi:hypothetical protein
MRMLAFLGVNGASAAVLPVRHSNRRHLPRSITLQWAARQVFGFKSRGYRIVNRWNHIGGNRYGYPEMDAATRRRLVELFQPHNARLEELTGLDLSAWGQKPAATADRRRDQAAAGCR